jgi:hypothetical protein
MPAMMFGQRVSGNWFSAVFRRPQLIDQLSEPRQVVWAVTVHGRPSG